MAASARAKHQRQRGNNQPTGSAFEALFHIGAQIQAKEIDLDSVLTTIVEQAATLVTADVSWLALLDEAHHHLAVRVVHGHLTPALETMTVPLGKGIGGVALQRHETIIVDDYDTFAQTTTSAIRRAIHDEGVVSIIGAPLFRDDRLIGVLYVGQRTSRTFDRDEPTLVSALAGQAAIAIENARLLQQLDAKNRLLEHTASIHARLTSVALRDAGVDGIAAELADLIGRPIWLFQDVIAPSRQRYGGSSELDTPDTPTATSFPILAGETELGTLAVEGTEPLSELDRRALEQGAVVIAVELLRHRARQEVEWRLGGELLGALLSAAGPVDGRLAARAARFGLDLRQPHMVIVLESTGDEPLDLAVVQDTVGRLGKIDQTPRGAVLVAATGVEHIAITIPEQRSPLAEMFLARLDHDSSPAHGHFIAGVSRALHDLSAAHREAMACVRLARISGLPGKVITAGELGAMRFLFAVDDPAPLREYVTEQLGALLEQESGREALLFTTLRAYLNASGHHPTISATCHIHASTVKYRISRLEAVLGRRLNDPQARFELQLAIALFDFLWAVGLDS